MRWLAVLMSVCACDPGVAPDASTVPGSDAAVDAPADAGPAPLKRVLFVGNSYTYFNDLPGVVRQIGQESRTPLEVEMIAVGGAFLYDHWVATGARERIEMGGLDAVVLQGQSQEAGGAGWIESATLFAGILADTETVWFATWARHGSQFNDPEAGPPASTDWIDRGYRDAAAINGDIVARVGAAWEIARVELAHIRLHTDDGSHPRPEGTLLAACVIHRALTGRSAVLPEPPPLSVAPEDAVALCALASRVTCPFEHLECAGECIEVASNPASCGACGVVCDADDPCRSGVCGCGDLPGYVGCERSCVHLPSDVANCGGCGVTCASGEVCAEGACLCQNATPHDIPFPEGLPGCPAWTDAVGAARLACNVAGHEHCAAFGCFDSGYAPPTGHGPTVDTIMCVRGNVRTTTLAELATHDPACTESLTAACSTAIHRLCVDAGFVSGFGPIGETATDLHITCLPVATVITTPRAALPASRCTPDPVTCGIGAWNYCESLGHPGGFGPVETDPLGGEDVDVVCFDP